MAYIKREQLAAIGIHYVYYPLDYMLDSQAKAGYKTIELLGMAPHYLMDETWYQDPAEVRKKVEDRGMTIGCFTPECAVYYYTMNAPEGGFHDRSMEYFKRGIEAAEKMGAKKLLTNCIGAPFDEESPTICAVARAGFRPAGTGDDTNRVLPERRGFAILGA